VWSFVCGCVSVWVCVSVGARVCGWVSVCGGCVFVWPCVWVGVGVGVCVGGVFVWACVCE
jgi:hypothetical protein